MKIQNQVAVVTGAGSGLGRSMALGLARKGAHVFLTDVREAEGKKVLEEVRSAGGAAELFVGDVSQENTVQQMVEACVERFGAIDLLINNAGVRMEHRKDNLFESWRCLPARPVHELTTEDWDLVLRVNLRSVFLCTHFVVPHMIQRRRGTIIGVSSNAGSRGVLGKSAYCASKHGVEGLMKTVAEEVRPHNISANAIHPGSRADVDGRGGLPPEVVVPVVLFLASQDDPAVTGQTINAREWNEKNAESAPA